LPRGGGAEECPNGAPDWWPGRLIATARAKRNFSIPHLLCERMPDPAPRRQDASGGGDSRRGTHGRDALVFRQRQLRVSSRKSAGGALGGCAREFPDAIGSRAGASSLPRASCIRPAREAALMARNEPDDELKAPSSVADICPERNSSTSIHRQRRAGEQEMVGPQSDGGLLPTSPDGGVAKPNGEIPGEGVRVSRCADWCGEVGKPGFPDP
jgi:hypothetical protein